ncbi:MAG TPA: glutathione S-transferase family protein [Stellaceae bacterium]|nr:glutathione S-transferase family protein [Stellaceae bacterium]
MGKVEIIGFPQSTYVRFVRMVCAEKGIDYEFEGAAPHSPEVSAIHPLGKVPVMRHDGFELYESKAIATYLDLTFPGPCLIPTEPRAAALTEQWVSLVNSVIYGTMIRNYFFAYILPKTPDGSPDRPLIDEVVPAMQAQLGVLDRALGKTGFFAGDELTVADLNLMPILYYIQRCPEGAAAVNGLPHLAAYYRRLAARPSFELTIPPPPPREARAS